jgi:8-oxo-dGTP diphosphatase
MNLKQFFNVRVYGLLINDSNEVLISDEQEYGMQFTKFPGGGLEYGEGLTDGLKREFVEECNVEVEIISHFYTTDFFVKSAFNDSQIISVYYLVKNTTPLNLIFKTAVFDFDGEGRYPAIIPLGKIIGPYCRYLYFSHRPIRY